MLLWQISLTLLLVWQSQQALSTSTQLSRNRFFTSGKYIIYVGSVSGSILFKSYYYTTPLVNTLSGISQVFYSTTEIDAESRYPCYPGNCMLSFVWYEINASSYSNTHLTTRINGFFQTPFFYYLTYSYLVIMNNNPFLNSHIKLSQIQFIPGTNSTWITYPTSYAAGDAITCTPMIKQIKEIYIYGNLNNYKYQFNIGITLAHYPSNQSLTAIIELPPYVISYANYSIWYLFIITDSTALSKDFPKLKFESNMISLPVGSTGLSYGLGLNLLNQDNNMFLGIGQFDLFNEVQPSLCIKISYTSSVLTIRVCGQVVNNPLTSRYISYSYAFFPYFECPPNYLIYNQTNNLCYDNCLQSNEYYNITLAQCQVCHNTCLTCYNDKECRTCDTAVTFRQLVNLTCSPINGYFESNTSIASKCSLNCVLCSGSASNCTKCVELTQALINGSCVSCYSIIEGCKTCNATVCFSCNSSYSIYNQTYCNLPCTSLFCLLCSNANTSFCFICSVGYVLVGGICQLYAPVNPVICGDLIIGVGEQCDDGNLINRDGCSSQCKQEQFYKCYSNTTSLGQNYTNYCAYTHAIDFSLISIEKLSYSNSLRILLYIKQYQQLFWNTRSTLSNFLVESPIPYKNMEVSFLSRSSSSVKLTQKLSSTLVSKYPQSSVASVVFEYLQSIHAQTITLSFNFSQSSDYALTQIPASTITLEAVPNNNHYAGLYSQQTYSKQKTLSNALLFVTFAALFMVILTFFVGSKRISTQMLTVIQVAYASLLTAPKVSPLFSAITSLSSANNGYNIMYSTQLRPFEDTLVSNRAKGAQFYSQFLYNFNAGALFIILPLLVGVTIFIINKVKNTNEKGQKRIKRMYQLALGEFTFAGLTISSCIIGVASVLEVQFGMNEMGTTAGMMSLFATAVFLFLYVVYGVIRAKSIFLFEEYNGILLNENFSLGFHLTYFYSGLLTGALLCRFNYFPWVNCAAMLLPIILYFTTLVKPVFRKNMDKLRTQLNLLTIVFLQIPFFYINLCDSQTFYSDDDAILLVPITVGILLLLNFLTNSMFIFYQIIKKVREMLNRQQKQKNHVDDEYQQLQKDFRTVNQQISKQIAKPMVTNSFIEYSQGQYKQFYEMNIIKPMQSPKSAISDLKSSKFQYSSFRRKVENKRVKDNQIDQI